MASNSLELNLSLKPAYTTKTVTSLLKDLSSIENDSKRLSVLSDYLLEHQEELSKVEASPQSGELPQCKLLLREAIETLKEEMLKIKMHMESNISMGQTPLMEFLATKCKNHETEDQREIVSKKCSGKANDLLLIPSAQNQIGIPSPEKKHKALLNTNQIPNPDSIQSWKTSSGMQTDLSFMTRKGHSSEKYGQMGQGGLNLKSDSQTLNYHPEPLTQSIWKNKRREWSPELHKRFMDALNLLGGIDVATPKQIKELMQVEGLTNDQVKSHLQKFRLHHKRLSEETYPEKQLAYKQNHWIPLLYKGDYWKPSTSQSALQWLGQAGSHELMGGGLSSSKVDDMGSKEGRLF